MQRQCAVCGKPFEARRPQARFCGATCRKRHSRNPSAAAPADAPAVVAPMTNRKPVGDLVEATRAELERLGRLDTVAGQQALRLADEMYRFQTAGGLAAISKELSRVLAEIRQTVNVVDDPIDELKARRDAKRRAAG
ncbi:hypothetical protein MSP7336_01811 [Mycobacterium shimoidei]|uniref:Uncharacterized protein n=2 Tax=Mycobacterium shimoidei TaxID=29313 RepID=A0A375YXL7_MYCSH|nr:hypothetical protein MSP7336_01811 [Mycobacterium shimoidei]